MPSPHNLSTDTGFTRVGGFEWSPPPSSVCSTSSKALPLASYRWDLNEVTKEFISIFTLRSAICIARLRWTLKKFSTYLRIRLRAFCSSTSSGSHLTLLACKHTNELLSIFKKIDSGRTSIQIIHFMLPDRWPDTQLGQPPGIGKAPVFTPL